MRTYQSLADDLARLLEAVEVAAADIQRATTEDDLVAIDGRLAAIYAGLYASRELRDAIDLSDGSVETAQQMRDALAILRWERDTRADLVALGATVLELRERIAEMRARAPRLRTHTVIAGDTLQSIAAAKLGSWEAWHRLAEVNRIAPASTLTPGTVLVLPERE